MTRFFTATLGLTLGLTCYASADDKKDEKKTEDFPKLIVAKWEITKAGGQAPEGTIIEFDKDKKVMMEITGVKSSGTYKLEKDKLTVKMKFGDIENEEVLTIKKLTEDALELVDKDGGVDVLKKKK